MRIRSTVHRLLDEIHLLTMAFPDVRDAFDADELPISFILERDFRRSERWLSPYDDPPPVHRPDSAAVSKESSRASEH